MSSITEQIDQYTGMRRSFSLSLLVLANLLPLAGVLFLGWDVSYLMLLYWSENLVIGIYTLLRMILTARPRDIPLLPFFVVHYGGFCAGHGFFLQALLMQDVTIVELASQWSLQLVFAALLISHGASFVANFLRGGERERLTPRDLMSKPYGRIVILHVAIIVGGLGAQALGQPVMMLLALVLLKIAVDVKLHLREHRAIAGE